MEQWIGLNVSVECVSPLGVYQGSILAADGASITLTKAFRNGLPYPEPRLTIKAADIKDLKIIEPRQEYEQTHSTISVSKPVKKNHRTTVSENLQSSGSSRPQPGTSHGGNKGGNGQQGNFARSKPIEIQQSHNSNHHSNSYGNSNSNSSITPKGKQWKKSAFNNEAFGTPRDDPSLMQEFDFEKNLALFDKRAIWEQLNHSRKPDLLRQTDLVAPKYRHDENVLSSSPAVYRAITIPDDKKGALEYVTDEGVIVPSVTAQLRSDLFGSVQNLGLHHNMASLLARAAADIALRLLGGVRRLDPRNAHQVPTVVVLVGAHKEGQVGVTCASQLASHGVNTVLHVSGHEPYVALLTHLARYQLSGHSAARAVRLLPTADLVIVALASHTDNVQYAEAAEWASKSKAAVIALDPPANGTAGVVSKISVLPAMPLSHSPDCGQLYLANVGMPDLLYQEHGVRYKSPFGAKNVVPLHPV